MVSPGTFLCSVAFSSHEYVFLFLSVVLLYCRYGNQAWVVYSDLVSIPHACIRLLFTYMFYRLSMSCNKNNHASRACVARWWTLYPQCVRWVCLLNNESGLLCAKEVVFNISHIAPLECDWVSTELGMFDSKRSSCCIDNDEGQTSGLTGIALWGWLVDMSSWTNFRSFERSFCILVVSLNFPNCGHAQSACYLSVSCHIFTHSGLEWYRVFQISKRTFGSPRSLLTSTK